MSVRHEAFPNVDLSVLTPRQYEVIDMLYACRCSERAVAEFLGVSRGTVRVHHQRALDKLAEVMSPTSHSYTDA